MRIIKQFKKNYDRTEMLKRLEKGSLVIYGGLLYMKTSNDQFVSEMGTIISNLYDIGAFRIIIIKNEPHEDLLPSKLILKAYELLGEL